MKLLLNVGNYLGVICILLGVTIIYKRIIFYINITINFIEWEIYSLNSSSFIIVILFDWMRLGFIGIVLLISSIVLIYSDVYISNDKGKRRFTLIVYLFVLSIVFLIISPNLVRILLGWDGLGLVSYCLVIYYQNEKSANAGIITILSNRIGDVAILIRIAWVINFGSWRFTYLQFIYSDYKIIIVLWAMILAGITKSAQIPFSAWLPAAIAAPTPVSALVHSSTLVTAGVYLLIRFNFIIGVNSFLFFIGILTIFISGLGANFEMDLKKIIALSTLRQLGLMIIILGAGLYELSFFHLIAHAIFKSLLFLCAGVFIHSIGDIQDIRLAGKMNFRLPVRSFYFISSSIALCGFPFLTGFYSKDLILEVYFISNANILITMLIYLSTIFTLTYSTRLIYYLYFSSIGGKTILSLSEEFGIIGPISVLFILSVRWGGWASSVLIPVQLILLPTLAKTGVLAGLFLLFILVIFIINKIGLNYMVGSGLLKRYLGTIWFLPGLTSELFIPLLIKGGNLLKIVDQGWMEFYGGQGINFKVTKLSIVSDLINYSNIKFYIFIGFLLFIITFILLMYLSSLNQSFALKMQRWI